MKRSWQERCYIFVSTDSRDVSAYRARLISRLESAIILSKIKIGSPNIEHDNYAFTRFMSVTKSSPLSLGLARIHRHAPSPDNSITGAQHHC